MVRDVPGPVEIQARDRTGTLLNSLAALAEPLQALRLHNPLQLIWAPLLGEHEPGCSKHPRSRSCNARLSLVGHRHDCTHMDAHPGHAMPIRI